MNIKECIENVTTFTDLKRVATEYVIDYRRLSFEELKMAMTKTAPQYYNPNNIKNTIDFFVLNPNRNIRILFEIFITKVLLNSDDFMDEFKTSEEKILSYEQKIIDKANEFEIDDTSSNVAFYKYVLEAAWELDNNISVDEQNLINKIREKLDITKYTSDIVEAKIGNYPTADNILHTKDEICEVRRLLQQKGILFPVRDSNNVDYDVIPTEIASAIRKIYSIDIKNYGFLQLLSSKYVRNKKYLLGLLAKADIELSVSSTLSVINETILERLNAHKILGGFSPNDGLDKATLSDWCSYIQLPTSGTKPELIDRIIDYYDNIKQIAVDESDERQLYYEFFDDLAHRNLKELRQQNIIEKDLECEHKFELATNYLFEKKLKVKPLIMNGTEHADGMLSFNNKLILWDNKSKETDVNLSDHIKQFDRYIQNSEKPVAVFMVIAPSFTDNSAAECAKYSMQNDTLILLITASELKSLAEQWAQKNKNDEIFPLGYFKQNGRFNSDLISL